MDQPGKAANPARGQLNRANECFPVLVDKCDTDRRTNKKIQNEKHDNAMLLSYILSQDCALTMTRKRCSTVG